MIRGIGDVLSEGAGTRPTAPSTCCPMWAVSSARCKPNWQLGPVANTTGPLVDNEYHNGASSSSASNNFYMEIDWHNMACLRVCFCSAFAAVN